MRIGILTQWYDPEPGPASTTGVMARELVRRGHEVFVLTGFPNYPQGRIAEGYKQQTYLKEQLEGVNVLRVPLYPNHSRSSLRRIANYVSFSLSAAFLGVPRLPRLDVLWVNYSPITLALPMWLIQLIQRTPVICEVADLWPDTLQVSGLSGPKVPRLLTKFLEVWCLAMYRSSTRVVHISPGAGDVLARRGVPAGKLHYIPKAADEAVYRPTGKPFREKLGIADSSTVLVYAGAMGAAQGLESLLRAVHNLDDSRLTVLLAGSGTEEQNLRRLADALKLRNVHFLGRIDELAMPDLLATGDLCYISLSPHPTSGTTMPSKTQAILASGKAILVAADGDVARIVETERVGFVAEPEDPDSIADGLRAAMSCSRESLRQLGVRARELYDRDFSVQRLGDQTERLMLSVVAPDRKRTSVIPRTDSQHGHSIVTTISKHDAKVLAELHQRAFPRFFLSELGLPFLTQFYRGFRDDPTAVVSVAHNERGVPIGVAVGSTDPAGFFRRLLIRRAVPFALTSLGLAIRNPKVIGRLLRAPFYRGDTATGAAGALLSSICVDPATRGTGLGAALLHAWVKQARSKGAKEAFLTTDADGNEAVNQFYRRCGWELSGSFLQNSSRRMNVYTKILWDIPAGSGNHD